MKQGVIMEFVIFLKKNGISVNYPDSRWPEKASTKKQD